MAAFGYDHGRGGFAVSPVAANEGVGEVPRPHAFIGVEGDDVSDFPAVDDFFQRAVELGIAQDVAHGHAAVQAFRQVAQFQGFFQRFGDGFFQQDVIAQFQGLFTGGVMVVILRADDGDVRQARLRQQGFRIRKQADGGAFLLGQVPHGFRAFLHGSAAAAMR